MVQRYVFEPIEGDGLRGYAVWGPMLGKETEADARTATRFLPDRRVSHYWTPEHVLAHSLSGPVGLPEGEAAWDTYLLFAPGVRWGEEPPKPSYVMHVERSLPKELELDGHLLREHATELLPGNDEAAGGGRSRRR